MPLSAEELKKGEKAELLAIQYFKRRKWNVLDVRNSIYWGNKDIDLIVEKDNRRFTFEIKSQKRIEKYNEIVIEMFNYEWNTDGWYYTSKADYFMFVSPKEEIGYIISAFDLKNVIENTKKREEYNEITKCSVIYLPLSELKAQKVDLGGIKWQ